MDMALPRALPALVAITVGAGVLSGCGGGVGTQPPRELSASDASQVLGATRTISRACAGDQTSRAGLPGAVETLVAETKENPNQIFEVGSGERALVMYKYAADIAGYLQRCGANGDAQTLLAASREAKGSV